MRMRMKIMCGGKCTPFSQWEPFSFKYLNLPKNHSQVDSQAQAQGVGQGCRGYAVYCALQLKNIYQKL